MTEELMESWARDFADWEVCDQCCINLFDKTPFARHFAVKWSGAELEFVKRAGFVLMARIATTDKRADDTSFEPFFALITRESRDRRNYVRKAVNWALRQIGKRNRALNECAVAVARTSRI
jgi:3-methyladenine DNA glycosylase AlkD